MKPAEAGGGRWRSHGFGLALDAGFAIAGCPPGTVPRNRPRVRMELADRTDVARALAPAGTTVISWRRDSAGRSRALVSAHPRDGYLLHAPRGGLFHVSRDGEVVRCAPTAVAPWRWQRALVGQVLPFVSTLRGLETLHACAVVIAGGTSAIAIVGPSGLGKSSVAAAMLMHGATLLADDVIALDAGGGEVVAHPAMGLLSLRRVTVKRFGESQVRQLGRVVGADKEGLRIAVARHPEPVPLAAVYFLEAAPGPGPVRLTEQPASDPRQLLGGTFIFAIRTPERLLNQLEVCSAIAGTARLVRVRVPRGADYHKVAQRLLADAADDTGARRTGS